MDDSYVLAVFLLGLFLGILSIINKLLLLRNLQSGWLTGMLIGFLSCYFFFAIDLWIISAAEFGFFFVMLYGALFDNNPNRTAKIAINFLISALSCLFFFALFSDMLEVYELISALSFVWSGYFLTTTWRRLGWALFVSAHLATAFAAWGSDQLVFAGLQLVSCFVCLYAFFYDKRNRASGQGLDSATF